MQGASFIALVGTLLVVPSVPVAGMALILGIDRLLSMFRAAINVFGNAVATVVVARWEGEIDGATVRNALRAAADDLAGATTAEAASVTV